MLELINITDEAMRNYHYLWYTHTHDKKATIFCVNVNDMAGITIDCSKQHLNSIIPEQESHFTMIDRIKKNSSIGKVIEIEATAPPCQDEATVEKYRIESICNFLRNISSNKEAFLKLMKFTKQSPTYIEDHDEYDNFINLEKYGYFSKNNDISRVSKKPFFVLLM